MTTKQIPRRTIALNTGGGDCPGLNAVIRAVVKRGVYQLGWRIIGIEGSFDGLLRSPLQVRDLTRDVVAGALTRGGTLLGTTNRGNPFKYTGKDGQNGDLSHVVAERLHMLGCEGLIALGGDGTMRICHELTTATGIKIVGVPKTIDNDLLGTDMTFGFNSAVEFATLAVDRLHTTAESHDRIMVVEVMGRDAGFIALHAGVGGGADAILIPEIPFDLDKVAERMLERQQRGRFSSIVVVAEGARAKDGTQQFDAIGASGATHLGGIGRYVAEGLHALTGIDTRYTVLGHLQRGGIPTAFDRILATRLGNHAVDLVERDEWNRMVVIKNDAVASVPIADVIGGTKSIDLNHDLLATARGIGVTFG
jgi:ATP-dependent phosphofructokinase / diphosphate-dependent phosphofructokinase